MDTTKQKKLYLAIASSKLCSKSTLSDGFGLAPSFLGLLIFVMLEWRLDGAVRKFPCFNEFALSVLTLTRRKNIRIFSLKIHNLPEENPLHF